MTDKELLKDILDKIPENELYFLKPLEGNSYKYIFRRRTFKDLFNYYKKKGITEKRLLKILLRANLTAYICVDIEKIVFFRLMEYDKELLFWNTYGYQNRNKKSKYVKNTKYTVKYLENLYKQIEHLI